MHYVVFSISSTATLGNISPRPLNQTMFKVFTICVAFTFFPNATEANNLLQPDSKYSPRQVIEIQLRALQQNDNPTPGNGIAQTWAFAHPSNRAVTGPLTRFTQMISSANYRFLLGHKTHTIKAVVKTMKMALYRVTIISDGGKKYSLQWRVLKVQSGALSGAWMTVAVSPPQHAGNAI